MNRGVRDKNQSDKSRFCRLRKKNFLLFYLYSILIPRKLYILSLSLTYSRKSHEKHFFFSEKSILIVFLVLCRAEVDWKNCLESFFDISRVKTYITQRCWLGQSRFNCLWKSDLKVISENLPRFSVFMIFLVSREMGMCGCCVTWDFSYWALEKNEILKNEVKSNFSEICHQLTYFKIWIFKIKNSRY